MLYGCEIWGALTKVELNTLERVQKKIGKLIQGLHRRTHDEIVRGLLGWNTINGSIDQCKLNFIHKLMSLPPNIVIKRIFVFQIYTMMLTPISQTGSITYDLWCTLQKYNLLPDIIVYLAGGHLVPKPLWKQFTRASIHTAEETLYRQGLVAKGATRFMRIHPDLAQHDVYDIIRSNMGIRRLLMNIVKLSAFVENSDQCVCDLCDQSYTDTVDHYIMRCPGLIVERMGQHP